MFYMVTVETRDAHDESFYEQIPITSRQPLVGKAGDRVVRRFARKFPDYKSIEVKPIEEVDFRIFRDFLNRHED